MAELFNFTGSQNQVRPQSPTANAVANTQAADTFKSLSNLFGTAIDASNTIKQREKAAEVEARRLAASQAASDKALQAQNNQIQRVNQAENSIVSEIDFQRAESEAGVDQDKITKAYAERSVELQSDFSNLSIENQDKARTSHVTKMVKLNTDYNSKIKGINKDNFISDSVVSDVQSMTLSLKEQEQIKRDQDDAGLTFGLTKKEMGDTRVKSRMNAIISNIDVETVTNNFDYDAIAELEQIYTSTQALEPKSVEALAVFRGKVDGIKNQVDSALLSQVKLASANSDRAAFDLLLEKGTKNGAISATSAYNLQAKFLSTGLSETNLNKASAQAAFANGTNSNLIANPKVRALLVADLTTQAGEDFLNKDTAAIKSSWENEPKLTEAAYKSYFSIAHNKAMAIDNNTSDEEKAAILQDIYNTEAMSYGHTSQQQRTDLSLTKYLLKTNTPDIGKVLRDVNTIGDKYTLLKKNDPIVRDLLEDLPLTDQPEALRLMSVYVQAGGLDPDTASDVVMETFKLQEFGDVGFNQGSLDILNKSIPTSDAQRGQIAQHLQNVLPPDEADKLGKIINRGGVSIVEEGGNLLVESEDGSRMLIPVNDSLHKALSEEVAAGMQEKVGIAAVAGSASVEISKVAAELSNNVTEGVSNLFGAASSTAELGAGIVWSNTMGDLVDSIGSYVNQTNILIDDIHKGVDLDVATSNWSKRTFLAQEKYAEDNAIRLEDLREVQQEAAKGAVKTVSESIAANLRVYNFFNDKTIEGIKATIDFLIPSAQAGVNMDLTDYESKMRSLEGSEFHEDTVGIYTSSYGINLEKHGKAVEAYAKHKGVAVKDLENPDYLVLSERFMKEAANTNSRKNPNFGKLDPSQQFAVASATYNTGQPFTKLTDAFVAHNEKPTTKTLETVVKQSRRRQTNPNTKKKEYISGLDNRAVKELVYAGVIDVNNNQHAAILTKYLPMWNKAKL